MIVFLFSLTCVTFQNAIPLEIVFKLFQIYLVSFLQPSSENYGLGFLKICNFNCFSTFWIFFALLQVAEVIVGLNVMMMTTQFNGKTTHTYSTKTDVNYHRSLNRVQ